MGGDESVPPDSRERSTSDPKSSFRGSVMSGEGELTLAFLAETVEVCECALCDAACEYDRVRAHFGVRERDLRKVRAQGGVLGHGSTTSASAGRSSPSTGVLHGVET